MSNKLKIVVTRAFTEKPNLKIEELSKEYEVLWWKEPTPLPRAKLLEWSKGASGILCMLNDKIDEELLEAAGSELKVVSTMSVGYEHIDLEALSKRNIAAGNTPGVLTDAVADLNLTLLLSLMRRIPEITGKTVGIFGLGRIGIATAKRIYGFSPSQIIYNTRSPLNLNTVRTEDLPVAKTLEAVDFDTLLSRSDVIIICTDMNPSTHHVFDQNAFQKMKPTSIIVNTSRGGIIDTDALVHALEHQQIYGAALDVTDPEPLPPHHPLTQNFSDRVVFTPHLGSATQETRDAMGLLALDNLMAGLNRSPLPASIFK